MIYVASDLHGYPLESFLQLLESVGFNEKDDFLYLLGDLVDRGNDGAELLKWASMQSNVQVLLGNHEAMLLSCSFLFDEVNDESLSNLSVEKMELLSTWLANGAAPTLDGLRKILKEDPDVFWGMMDLLKEAPLFEVLEVNSRRFVLVHGGLENFRPDRRISEYLPEEILWARPDLNTEYFTDGTIVVFGHSPTHTFHPRYNSQPIITKSWICIDAGVTSGNRPIILRLDDLQVFN